MKKQNILYTLLFCMMAMVVSFASCSDDDENNSSQGGDASALVGNWLGGDGEDTWLYVFNSNGTFVYYEREEDGFLFVEKGTYQYNASREELDITTTYSSLDDDQKYLPWTEVYNVISVSQNTLVIADSESSSKGAVSLTRTSKTSL